MHTSPKLSMLPQVLKNMEIKGYSRVFYKVWQILNKIILMIIFSGVLKNAQDVGINSRKLFDDIDVENLAGNPEIENWIKTWKTDFTMPHHKSICIYFSLYQ